MRSSWERGGSEGVRGEEGLIVVHVIGTHYVHVLSENRLKYKNSTTSH